MLAVVLSAIGLEGKYKKHLSFLLGLHVHCLRYIGRPKCNTHREQFFFISYIRIHNIHWENFFFFLFIFAFVLCRGYFLALRSQEFADFWFVFLSFCYLSFHAENESRLSYKIEIKTYRKTATLSLLRSALGSIQKLEWAVLLFIQTILIDEMGKFDCTSSQFRRPPLFPYLCEFVIFAGRVV